MGMMKILFRLSFVLPLIFCSGCIIIPYHFTARPGANGIVEDEQIGIPLANVHVVLSTVYGTGNGNPTNEIVTWFTNELVSTSSKDNGTFQIPPKKQWGLLIIPSDHFPRDYELKAESTNYYPAKIHFNSFDEPLLETIRLSRKPEFPN
jgi:hypothetical protein